MNFGKLVGKAIVKLPDGSVDIAASRKVYEELCLDEFTNSLHLQEIKLQSEMRVQQSSFCAAYSEYTKLRNKWDALSEKYVIAQFNQFRSELGQFGAISKSSLVSMAVGSMLNDKMIDKSDFKQATEMVKSFIKNNGSMFAINSVGLVRLKK